MPIRERLGERYRLVKTLRTTPVYHEILAKDGKRGGDATLWLLPTALTSDPEVAPRFMRALKAQLDAPAPGSVRVIGGGVVSGTAFLRVQPSRTECLRTRLLSWRPSVDEATRVIGETCKAISAAHDHAYLHGLLTARDVLFIDGAVRLGGIGLWTALARRPLLAALWHEAHVIAPEVRRGGEPGVTADLFGVAAVAAELLQAATGFTTAALRKRGWHPLLIEAIDRLLAGEPSERPPSLSSLETAATMRAPPPRVARGSAPPEARHIADVPADDGPTEEKRAALPLPPRPASPAPQRPRPPAPLPPPPVPRRRVSIAAPLPGPPPPAPPLPPPPWAPAPTRRGSSPLAGAPRLPDAHAVKDDAITSHFKRRRATGR
jgi:hypothetical protein